MYKHIILSSKSVSEKNKQEKKWKQMGDDYHSAGLTLKKGHLIRNWQGKEETLWKTGSTVFPERSEHGQYVNDEMSLEK